MNFFKKTTFALALCLMNMPFVQAIKPTDLHKGAFALFIGMSLSIPAFVHVPLIPAYYWGKKELENAELKLRSEEKKTKKLSIELNLLLLKENAALQQQLASARRFEQPAQTEQLQDDKEDRPSYARPEEMPTSPCQTSKRCCYAD